MSSSSRGSEHERPKTRDEVGWKHCDEAIANPYRVSVFAQGSLARQHGKRIGLDGHSSQQTDAPEGRMRILTDMITLAEGSRSLR